jgi:hypothetical protein
MLGRFKKLLIRRLKGIFRLNLKACIKNSWLALNVATKKKRKP